MNFPKNLKITIKDHSTKKPISNVLFYIELIAPEKNNYYIGPFLTDTLGETIISKIIVNKQISESRALFIMDYVSSLEDCKENIKINIFNGKELRQRLHSTKKYFPEDAKHLEDLFNNSINEKFTSNITKIIAIKDQIIVEI